MFYVLLRVDTALRWCVIGGAWGADGEDPRGDGEAWGVMGEAGAVEKVDGTPQAMGSVLLTPVAGECEGVHSPLFFITYHTLESPCITQYFRREIFF